MRGTLRLYRSGEPNLVVRYSVRPMPSRGTQSLRKYGWNRTCTSRSGRDATAFSSRRLPMKHHGHTTSETTSMVSGSAVSDMGGLHHGSVILSENRCPLFGITLGRALKIGSGLLRRNRDRFRHAVEQ